MGFCEYNLKTCFRKQYQGDKTPWYSQSYLVDDFTCHITAAARSFFIHEINKGDMYVHNDKWSKDYDVIVNDNGKLYSFRFERKTIITYEPTELKDNIIEEKYEREYTHESAIELYTELSREFYHVLKMCNGIGINSRGYVLYAETKSVMKHLEEMCRGLGEKKGINIEAVYTGKIELQ